MGKRNLQFWLFLIACCVLLTTEAKAQNTYGYSSISYDPGSNTITAYADTNPDYNTQAFYYNAYVSSNIKDASGNVLASQNGFQNVSFSLSGNGSSSYTISSGHYMVLSYVCANVYSPCNLQYYYSAYFDYYNYMNFTESPNPDGTFSIYVFFGPGPQCYTPSSDVILGGSTDSYPELGPAVTFNNAKIYGGSSGKFSDEGGVQAAHLTATGSQCNSNSNFTLTVNYWIPLQTKEIYQVTATDFGDWYVDSSTINPNYDTSKRPPTGTVSMTVSKQGGTQTGGTTSDGIQVTVKGHYNSGSGFSTPGMVHIVCQ